MTTGDLEKTQLIQFSDTDIAELGLNYFKYIIIKLLL